MGRPTLSSPMEILPSIDIRDGKVVRLKQGDFAQQTDYAVDPIDQVKTYADAGATLMHLVDLDGTKAGHVAQAPLIAKIVQAARKQSLAIEVGGGIRSTADVDTLLSAGVARVVVGTAALENWDWFEKLVHDRPQKIVLALDAKDGIVATRGWQDSSGQEATALAAKVSAWPLAALLYTDIAVDGMLTGPNYAHTAKLVQATSIPILASGGVGSIDHIAQLKPTGAWGVVVGKAIYEGKIDLPQAIALARASVMPR